MCSRLHVAVVLFAGCVADRAAPQQPTTAPADPQPATSPQPTGGAAVPPMGPCEKHPTTIAARWALVGEQCALVTRSIPCRGELPPGLFETVAACDAASHVTTKLAVVKLMTATGKVAEANARDQPPSCAAVGFRDGAACSADAYGLVCALEASGTAYLACVLPQAPLPHGQAADGNICYGLCNSGRGTTTYLGVASTATCRPVTMCGAPP